MHRLLRSTLATALVAAACSASAAGDHDSDRSDQGSDTRCTAGKGQRSDALEVVGLTSDQRLICFSENRPGKARTIGAVTGLIGPDTSLVGIDFRVQDGKLYGVGNAGGVYSLDVVTAAATFQNRVGVALTGSRFGVDFNPVANRLRIVSDAGQNLRHDVMTGATVQDFALNYVPGTVALGVTGSAYTNNDLDASTATTLYALDTTLDQIAIQSPPNNGSLAATGKLTIATGDMAGFDIYSIVRHGVTLDVLAFASLTSSDGTTAFYEITLPTGKATARGSFGSRNQVVDIAIPLNQL